jgi:hypothetical protein
MGNRANFVIVKDQDWQLYYSHWGGCRMLDALIGGPDLALRYAASLRRCEKDEWCDPSWADGGAVVDLDHRRVLFFGEPLMVSMNERRLPVVCAGARQARAAVMEGRRFRAYGYCIGAHALGGVHPTADADGDAEPPCGSSAVINRTISSRSAADGTPMPGLYP